MPEQNLAALLGHFKSIWQHIQQLVSFLPLLPSSGLLWGCRANWSERHSQHYQNPTPNLKPGLQAGRREGPPRPLPNSLSNSIPALTPSSCQLPNSPTIIWNLFRNITAKIAAQGRHHPRINMTSLQIDSPATSPTNREGMLPRRKSNSTLLLSGHQLITQVKESGHQGNSTAGPRSARGTPASERRMSSDHENEARHLLLHPQRLLHFREIPGGWKQDPPVPSAMWMRFSLAFSRMEKDLSCQEVYSDIYTSII